MVKISTASSCKLPIIAHVSLNYVFISIFLTISPLNTPCTFSQLYPGKIHVKTTVKWCIMQEKMRKTRWWCIHAALYKCHFVIYHATAKYMLVTNMSLKCHISATCPNSLMCMKGANILMPHMNLPMWTMWPSMLYRDINNPDTNDSAAQ